jgi:hypothetical protein
MAITKIKVSAMAESAENGKWSCNYFVYPLDGTDDERKAWSVANPGVTGLQVYDSKAELIKDLEDRISLAR